MAASGSCCTSRNFRQALLPVQTSSRMLRAATERSSPSPNPIRSHCKLVSGGKGLRNAQGSRDRSCARLDRGFAHTRSIRIVYPR